MERIVPSDVAAHVAKCTRKADLRSLCRVSKAFAKPVQQLLWRYVQAQTPRRCYYILYILMQSPHLANYIRELGLYLDPFQLYADASEEPEYWEMFAATLKHMRNLETLAYDDPTYANSWILAPDLPCRLTYLEAPCWWDAPLVAFLASQPRLRMINAVTAKVESTTPQWEESSERHPLPEFQPPPPLPPGSLPVLQKFGGHLNAAMHILSSPISHLKVRLTRDIETQRNLLKFIHDIVALKTTLRSLCVSMVSESVVVDTLVGLGKSAPQLEYLGVIALPRSTVQYTESAEERSKVADLLHYRTAMIAFRKLRYFEVSVSHWEVPPIPFYHPFILAELRTYCPSLTHVVIRMRGDRGVDQRHLWKLERTGEGESDLERDWVQEKNVDWDRFRQLWARV